MYPRFRASPKSSYERVTLGLLPCFVCRRSSTVLPGVVSLMPRGRPTLINENSNCDPIPSSASMLIASHFLQTAGAEAIEQETSALERRRHYGELVAELWSYWCHFHSRKYAKVSDVQVKSWVCAWSHYGGDKNNKMVISYIRVSCEFTNITSEKLGIVCAVPSSTIFIHEEKKVSLFRHFRRADQNSKGDATNFVLFANTA